MSHSLVLMSVFFILGILIGNRLPLAPGWLWAVLAVLMVAGAVSLKLGRRALGHQLLLALVLTAGALRVQIASPWIDPTHYLSRDRLGPGRFQVQVVGDPFSGADQIRAPVEIRSVIEGERWVPLSGQARLLVNAGSGPLVRPAYGEVLELDGVLESPGDRFVGPGRRLKDQWASEGFHAVLKPTGQIKVQARDRGSPIHASLYALRHRISGVLDQTHPPEVAALIRALLLGIRDLAPEVMADYRITGTYHILSISGCHVALVAVALAALFTGLKAPRKLSAILIVVVLIAYAFMTGESPSVLRATFMACVFILGQLLARPLSIYTSLAFSAIALLLIDPLSIFTASFQLSFLAVLSIAYLTPPLMTRLDFLPPYLNSLVSTSLSASLGTAPVLATSFGSLSLVSPLANLVVVPLFGIIMPIAMLAIVGSLFSPWVPFFFGAANYGFVTLQHRLIHGLAQVPFASVDVSEIPPVVWVVYS
ncbi:MAG: ComEC/Rec2 family competence protein, partial [Candidatus Riflebacteria bacterium]|nr:ComEC/Rec2 family competence protein [Candidatus Riflebacteria bacterium]